MRGRVAIGAALAAAIAAVPVAAEMRLVVPASAPVKRHVVKRVATPAVAYRKKGRRPPAVKEVVEPQLPPDPQFCKPDGSCQIHWKLVAEDIEAAGFSMRFARNYPKTGVFREVIEVGPSKGAFDGSRWRIIAKFAGQQADELWLYAPVATSFVPTKAQAKAGIVPEGLEQFALTLRDKWNGRFRPKADPYVTSFEVSSGSQPHLFRRIQLDDYVLMGGRDRLRAALIQWKTDLATLPSFIRELDPKALPPA